jgi:hypothetical protein
VTLLHVSVDAWLAQEGDRPVFEVVLETLESHRTTVTAFPAGPDAG